MTEELPGDIGNPYSTLTTKEGWRAFVDEHPEPPAPLAPGAVLDAEELDSYQEARKDYHSSSVIVATPTIRKVVTTGRKRIVLNRHQVSARRGLIVSGSSGTGKTTAITQLGKNVEQLARRRNPAATAQLPVVFVTVPPAATPKMLAGEFARFLGLPLLHRMSQVQITNAVCDLLAQLGTTLVLVDEIHNLDLTTRYGAEASDQLKYLSERMAATFVLAGLDIETSSLFQEPGDSRSCGRYSVILPPLRTPQPRRPRAVAGPHRDIGGVATAAPAPAWHSARSRCVPARTHWWSDRQSLSADPGGSSRGDRQRCREDHQTHAGYGRTRPHR